ncbi:hypothetical protein Leryth_027662 [Lithospermum erythrorhizon]|nr:hypothetical protein Leryth_027662 [Lithospermum erythrorhizon]
MLISSIVASSSDEKIQENFVECMASHSNATNNLHIRGSPMYTYLLEAAEQNPRWLNTTTLKPSFIITPNHAWEIQATVVCSKEHGLLVRVKSGGHDYEGLSYLCNAAFIIIDLTNFRSLAIDIEKERAWIQSGVTLGELYYSIGMKSKVHGFPAGLCPSVGVGGHFSGGGIGTLIRKYGLASDNVINAYLVDVNGRFLDRKSMGEDLFWAIRGGGGGSFGVVTAWKVKLVRVPKRVTVFTIHKKMNQEGKELVFRWQNLVNKMPHELFIRVVIQNVVGGGQKNEDPIEILFNSLFLGSKKKALAVMKRTFPELGLEDEDCEEISWIESVLYFYGYKNGEKLEVLLGRTDQYKGFFKAKSDFVQKPIPIDSLDGIKERFLKKSIVFMIMDPFGGRMDEISESESPFPHRKGNLYNIQYLVKWNENSDMVTKDHIDWVKELYDYMEPYVCRSPRSAYINYRDLDLGSNKHERTSYLQAKSWGEKYFKGNFKRLVLVKSMVDPGNFFRNEQSVPPISELKD